MTDRVSTPGRPNVIASVRPSVYPAVRPLFPLLNRVTLDLDLLHVYGLWPQLSCD